MIFRRNKTNVDLGRGVYKILKGKRNSKPAPLKGPKNLKNLVLGFFTIIIHQIVLPPKFLL